MEQIVLIVSLSITEPCYEASVRRHCRRTLLSRTRCTVSCGISDAQAEKNDTQFKIFVSYVFDANLTEFTKQAQ